MGTSCYRAHSWLEIIFHPLLFKTKLCESNLKKGVCRKYGIYCAKAHNESEVRNLVSIYGKDWKRHYEAYQTSESEKPLTNKYKQKLAKCDNVLDSSHPSCNEHRCPLVKSSCKGDLCYQIYGGSPLFMSTPPVSLFQSMSECADIQEGFLMDSIDFCDLGQGSAVDGEELDVHTTHFKRMVDIVAGNPIKDPGTCTQFNDCFTWAFDWTSSQEHTFSKEPVSANSESDELEGNYSNGSGSWTCGSKHPCSLSSSTSMTDQEVKLSKTQEDGSLKILFGCGMSNWHYLPDEQAVNQSLDQQDWELKLRERGNENELNAACILPSSNDLMEKVIEQRE